MSSINDEMFAKRLAEAWALIRTGDRFNIGRRFLARYGVV